MISHNRHLPKTIHPAFRQAEFKRKARKIKQARLAPKSLKQTLNIATNLLLSSVALAKPQYPKMKFSHLMPSQKQVFQLLVFVLVIGSAYAHTNEISDGIQDICTTNKLFTMSNKPQMMRMDMLKNMTWTPAPCAISERSFFSTFAPQTSHPFEPECYAKINTYHNWRKTSEAKEAKDGVILTRNLIYAEYDKTITEFDIEYSTSIKPHLTTSQTLKIEKQLKSISKLIDFFIDSKQAQASLYGNCGEHASDALIKILKLGLKHKTIINLQLVVVYKPGIDNHAFVIVDGDGKNTKIINDESAVKNYLDQLKKGHICDVWNDGYYEEVAKTTNALYKGGAWSSISVENVSLNFDFSYLPQIAIDFLMKILQSLGLNNLFGQPQFTLFSPTVVSFPHTPTPSNFSLQKNCRP